MRLAVALTLVAAALLSLLFWVVGARPRLIQQVESEFGRIRVYETRDGLRSLRVGEGRARQSAIYPGRPQHLELPYTRVSMVGVALAPTDGRALFVGLGGGAMPMYLRQIRPAMTIEVVEIDPRIVDVAISHFGFQPDDRMIVHTGDGRAFIETSAPGTFDLIVLDAFSDDEIPYSLATRQFLESVERALAPGGTVVSNLWTRNPLYDSMLATYGSTFEDPHLLQVRNRAQRILVARKGAVLSDADLIDAARRLADSADLGFDLERLARVGYVGWRASRAPILEDVPEEGVRSPP